jgi:hypothetical protein
LDAAKIVQLRIFLVGPPEGSKVTAVIYANDAGLQFPSGSQVLARSVETLNVTSLSGEWYNFTMNFVPYGNATYWFGYYSDGFTRNLYDVNAGHVLVVSSGGLLPDVFSGSFSYSASNMMSLYAVYEPGTPNLAPTPTITPSATPNPTQAPTLKPESSPSVAPSPTLSPAPSPSPTKQPAPTSISDLTAVFGNPDVGKQVSELRSPNSVTLCNFSTPLGMAKITQISILLIGTPQGSNVTAVVYANDPGSKLPMSSQLLARSQETLNVTSTSGEWYNFTLNFVPYDNTTYWFGYYSEGFTRNFYAVDANHVSLVSSGGLLPEVFSGTFSLSGSSMMSLYGVYEGGKPNPAPNSISGLPAANSLLSLDVLAAIGVSSASSAATGTLIFLRRKKLRNISLIN